MAAQPALSLERLFDPGIDQCLINTLIAFPAFQFIIEIFQPAFPLKHMQKDMRLALLMGDHYSQPLFTAAAANNAYIKARKAGCADEDFAAVVKAVRN